MASNLLTRFFRDFQIFTRCNRYDPTFVPSIVDIINCFPRLISLAFREIIPTKFTLLEGSKILRAVLKHPTLTLAQLGISNQLLNDFLIAAGPAVNLQRIRTRIPQTNLSENLKCLLSAGLQIETLEIRDMQTLNAWLHYPGIPKIHYIDFRLFPRNETDDGEEMARLVAKYQGFVKSISVDGEHIIQDAIWIRHCLSGLQFDDDDIKITSLDCHKLFNGLFSRVSMLSITSSKPQKYLLALDSFRLLCSRIHSKFPDLEDIDSDIVFIDP